MLVACCSQRVTKPGTTTLQLHDNNSINNIRGNYYSRHKQDDTLNYTTHLNHEHQVNGTRYSQHDKTNCESTIRLTMIELNTLKCKPMLLVKHYLEQKNDLIHIPFPSDINKQEFG
jgi:hypothetical protein